MNVADIISWAWDFGDGITSIQQNTVHVYAAPGDYKVTLTVTDISGCIASKTRAVTVNPLPVAMFNISQIPCASEPVHFDDVSAAYAGFISEWNWDFGDGNTQTILHPANPDTDHTYANAGTYTVKLTIKSSDSCTAERIETLVINPAPTANFDFENPCQGTPVQFNDLTQTAGTGNMNGWSWNFGDGATGANNTSTLQNPTHTYSASGTYQVSLTVSTANGCTSTIVKDVIITVAPFVDFSYDNHCVSTSIQFTPAGSVNTADVTTWNWSFGDGITSALPNPQHTYNTPGNYNVTLTITNTTGCQNTISHILQILPAPVASFSTTSPACSQHEVNFANQSTAAAGYIMRWEYNFGDGNTTVVNFPANPNVSHTYSTYGNYTVSLTVVTNDSCSATTTRNVQILQSPLANFDFDVTCMQLPVQFTDLSQGNMISWAWNFGDPGSGIGNTSYQQNPVHTYQQAGNYTVNLLIQNMNGCNDTVSRTVTILPKPAVDFSFNNGCATDTVNFNSSAYVNVATTSSWLWEFGDNNTSSEADPFHVYMAPGTYNVTLTITNQNGCTNVKTRQVQVTTAPIALFNSNTTSCTGTAVLFTDLSSTPNGTISTWNWDFGDGTIVTVNAPANPNVTHAFIASGIYDVVLTIYTSTGCEAFYTSSVEVIDASLTAFSYSGSCSGIPTSFTDLSQASSGNIIIGWSWDFGDPASGVNNVSTLPDPQHTFTGQGTYNVTLTTVNLSGCTSSEMQVITVTPQPAVDFTTSAACDGSPVLFTADPAVTNIPDVASYLWNFGDGSATSTLASPEHLYAQAGTYMATLTIANLTGCENSVSREVTVHTLPVSQFTTSGNCTNNLVQFNDISYNPGGEEIVAWSWDFGVSTSTGDTSSLQNPTYIYTQGGTYNVTLTVTSESGCTSVKVMPVNVIPAPVAQYSYTAEPCHNGSVLFKDESTSSQSLIIGWYWEFAPGVYSTLQNPVFVFGNTDTCFNVKLAVTTANGCTDTLVQEVCIPSGLDVAVDFTQTCFGEPTWFIPTLVQPTGGSIAFYNWNFGDPSTGINNESKLANPQHIFSKPGTFIVSLQAIDINNCISTTYKTITVDALPRAAFSHKGGACDSLVTFKDMTTGAAIASWTWDFGDGHTETALAPSSPDLNHYYPYPGIYQVTLITQSVAGCSDTITQPIRRTPCISAEIAIADTVVCPKRNMRFTEASTCEAPIASWQWFFGDNTSVTYTTPQPYVEHTYTTAGNYTVKMVVATQMVGGMVTDTATSQVNVKPSAKAAYAWQDVCFGNTTEFNNLTQNNNTTIKSYNWNFGDPTAATDTTTVKHPSYTYGLSGEFEVKLVVINTLGCSDTIVNTVKSYAIPTADFNWNSSCEANPVIFTDNSDTTNSAIDKWNWLFSKEDEVLGASTDRNCSFIFPQAGIYEVDMKITDRNGCATEVKKEVAINASPVAAFSIVDNYENKQGQIMLNNGTINGTGYEWDFGNGKTSSGQSPVATYEKEGSYDIRLITWNGQNCVDTLTMTYELMFKGLFVPNAFEPSNLNSEVQIFKPKGTNLMTYYLEIYDRWGNLLWSTSELDSKGSPVEGWDGKLHGEVMKQDVYLWKISARFKDGTIWDGHNTGNNENMPQTNAGTVTLIR
jgi:PKD repeat protein